jgi:ribA/ribD-fused uncharacterized protein
MVFVKEGVSPDGERMTAFYHGHFSNFYFCSFKMNGVSFNCSEQAYMHAKALFFNDKDTAAEILAAKEPKQQKRLGRMVKGFDAARWAQVRFDVMWQCLMAKYGQNTSLHEKLLQTGDSMLIEASYSDGVWGVRRGLSDPLLFDRKCWLGTNLLGQCLCSVRDSLK